MISTTAQGMSTRAQSTPIGNRRNPPPPPGHPPGEEGRRQQQEKAPDPRRDHQPGRQQEHPAHDEGEALHLGGGGDLVPPESFLFQFVSQSSAASVVEIHFNRIAAKTHRAAMDFRRPASHGRSHAVGSGDAAASNSGSRAREGPGRVQRQSLWSIQGNLGRCLKGSETNTQY